MPINNITQTISTIPEAGHRGVDVQTQFVIKQEDFQDHLQGTTVTELNTLKDQLNSRIGEINSTTTTMNGYATTASAGALTATTEAEDASTSASGALTSKNQAETFNNNASASATKASQWADNNYNVAVETGKYSAKHWATVAETVVVDTVKLTGNQTIAGVKTFSSSPIVPTPSADTQAANKQYVDSAYSGFKNLIINGRKQVNQSGLTTTDNTYNYDNHYKVGNNWFMFIDEKDIVSGEPYTLSWDGVATAGYYIGTAGALTINSQTFIPIANGETIAPTLTSSQILWIKFASDASGSTYTKVQFEQGNVPTPYEQRLKEFEEFLVTSVYERFIGGSPASGVIASGAASLSFRYNRKRKVPTLLYDNIIGYSIHTGTANIAINSMSISGTETSAELQCAISSGTAGQSAQLRGGTGWIALDARPY